MEDQKTEWLACETSFPYFVDNYVQIYDATAQGWIPFRLWNDQIVVAEELVNNRLNVILKARQLGLTWLVLSYILWLMIFHPAVTILLYSRREIESIYLLDKRLKGMYKRLPEWAMVRTIVSDSAHTWELSNGSVAYAFPTTAGDSYTASLAFVDEADLVPDLETLMLSVKPTIDGGGRMVLLSRSNKELPNSPFKKVFLAAWTGQNEWHASFLPWYARPERTPAWYEAQRVDFQSRTGSLDGLYEQYPATPEEALAPRSLNRRIPFGWLQRCYAPLEGILSAAIPQLRIFKGPQEGYSFVISADTAEGNPNSDDSSAHVLNRITLEECAAAAGKFEPTTFAQYLIKLSGLYREAPILVERNNHGHAVIAGIVNAEKERLLLRGPDGKYGWPTSAVSKALVYDDGTELFKNGSCTLHSKETFLQLASIEGSTLKAPEGDLDDRAVSFMLGLKAATIPPAQTFGFNYVNSASHRYYSKPNSRGRRHISRALSR